jgi:hypothetical protein
MRACSESPTSGLNRACVGTWQTILAGLALALLHSVAHAVPAPEFAASACAPGVTTVAFINGVGNSLLDAETSARDLKRKVSALPPQGTSLRFELLYNPTGGLVQQDLVEAYVQRAPPELKERMDVLHDILKTGGGNYRTLLAAGVPDIAELIGEIVAASADVLARYATQVGEGEAQVARSFAERTDAVVRQGQRLVVVAHSQGNLFGRPLVERAQRLSGQGHVSYVQVAPPNADVTGLYMLANEDLVIAKAVAAALPGVAVPNVFIEACNWLKGCANRPAGQNGKTGFLGHEFSAIYLNDAMVQTDPRKKSLGLIFNDLMTQALNEAQPLQRACPVLPSLLPRFTGLKMEQNEGAYDDPGLCDRRRLLSRFVIASDGDANDGGTFYASGCHVDAFGLRDTSYYQYNRRGRSDQDAGWASLSFGDPTQAAVPADQAFYFSYEDATGNGSPRVRYRRGATNFQDIRSITGPLLSDFVSHQDRMLQALDVLGSFSCKEREALIRLAGSDTSISVRRAALLRQDNGDLIVRAYLPQGRGWRQIEAVMFTQAELVAMANQSFSEVSDDFNLTGESVTSIAANDLEVVNGSFVKYLSLFAPTKSLINASVLLYRFDLAPLPSQDVVTMFVCTRQ